VSPGVAGCDVPVGRRPRSRGLRRPAGMETDRIRAHIRGMSEPQYEFVEAGDGTFTVGISGGLGSDLDLTRFASRREAEEWIKAERLRLGIDPRWTAIED
jgi:hypothetical protein